METVLKTDEKFMRAAILEAQVALNLGEVPIGAVVVCDGHIVGRGHNLTEQLCDATAHAEMQALTAAASTLGGKFLDRCVLYVTVEPCAMCAGACYWTHLGGLVWGADDLKRGFRTASQNILHPKTEVRSGVLSQECGEMVTRFFEKKR